MKQAPLQLLDYWVDYIQVRTNQNFDPAKPEELEIASIELQSKVVQIKHDKSEETGTDWLVSLRIEQPLSENQNIPYSYTLQIEGLVTVHPKFQGSELERQIQVNGPSMLFGSAREIIRAETGRGRFAPIIIPSTNFFQRLPPKPAPELNDQTTSTDSGEDSTDGNEERTQ